jgi:predicted Zn-dependent protease
MEKSNLKKIFVIGSGMAFLGSSVIGLSSTIGSSLNQPVVNENAAQSQNAQLKAEEQGFEGVLKREPNNQTALRGLVELRMRRGDIPGTKTAVERLVKLNPTNEQYKGLLVAIDQQIAQTKKVGTLKPTEPKQPTQPTQPSK